MQDNSKDTGTGINVDINSSDVIAEHTNDKFTKKIGFVADPVVAGKMKALAAEKGLSIPEIWDQAAVELLIRENRITQE